MTYRLPRKHRIIAWVDCLDDDKTLLIYYLNCKFYALNSFNVEKIVPKFSERHGYIDVTKSFQREAISDELRTALWNLLNLNFWYHLRDHQEPTWLVQNIWVYEFNYDIDELCTYKDYPSGSWLKQLKEYFNRSEWYKVFDLIEYILNQIENESDPSSFELSSNINDTLEEFNSAYRVVNKEIIEITSTIEIQSIQDGVDNTNQSISEHLQSSLRLLSDRQNPDFRNSIKESISAVEACLRLKFNDPSVILSQALKNMGDTIHPAMKQAFEKLYAYTSDENGIRHSLTEDSTRNPTYAEAKFMLVTCSAFTSFIQTISIN